MTGLLALIGWGLSGEEGLQTAANLAQLVGVLLVVPTLLVPLWLWRRRSTVRPAVTSAHVDHAKDVLAGLVEQQWKTEATLRSLDDPDPIPVIWRQTATAAVMDQPANLTPGVQRLTASSDDIATLTGKFRSMRRRRLVILGGPGTGKTTLAVQLVRELLATRTAHPGEPVPVLMSVAGWDTEAFPRLHQWLAIRLDQDYPALRAPDLPTGTAETLAARGHILPVLDGLDELPPAAQHAVIVALNQSLADTDQLIVTSRTTEFSRAVDGAGDVLTSAMVIEPQPITPKTAAAYLKRCLPPQPPAGWEQTLAALRATPADIATQNPSATLAAVVGTALGLWLLRVVYIDGRADPEPLLDPDRFPGPDQLRGHLLDQLIPALIRRRPLSTDPGHLFRPRRRHNPQDATRWLTWLACHLTHPRTPDGRPRTRDFVWWHLARHTLDDGVRTEAIFAAAAAVGVMLGLGFGLVLGLAFGWGIGLTFGCFFAGVFGFAVVGGGGEDPSLLEPGYANLSLHHRGIELVKRLTGGLGLGIGIGLFSGLGGGVMGAAVNVLTVGLSGGLLGALVDGLVGGLVGGLAGGLLVGFLIGLIGWAASPAPLDRVSTPAKSLRGDRTLVLLRATTYALVVGSLAGPLIGPWIGSSVGPPAGPSAGLLFGLLIGLVSGLVSALRLKHPGGVSWSYLVALSVLNLRRKLPRNLMAFLDDAHRLGLLRTVGPIYQFRHADLQDHLAADLSPAMKSGG
ncbi:NACHT domain-containing protein [Herbidospora yilanensis]|uniref:NACHT domain-containing protein n=1 Tax=Herbidospora yilanensis TaxID=354426 RepID=UPI0018DBA5EA|nr:NACHT domain-containing protein [Herbidospora yilanensis]